MNAEKKKEKERDLAGLPSRVLNTPSKPHVPLQMLAGIKTTGQYPTVMKYYDYSDIWCPFQMTLKCQQDKKKAQMVLAAMYILCKYLWPLLLA